MSFINQAAREITNTIVYCGPGLGGKTANVQYISAKTAPELTSGKMVDVAAPDDNEGLYFDFLSLTLGEMRGFKTKFNLYTVPGQAPYEESRQLILTDVDGIVFVADSQMNRMEANLEAMETLRRHLVANGSSLDAVPVVMQYNKRDLSNAASVDEMRRLLNARGAPDIEATAINGVGVLDTLKVAAKMVLQELKKKADAGTGGPRSHAFARRGPAS